MATRKGANRYPRHGDRIAPATLRQLLLDEAPSHLTGEFGSEVRLCDLDETVWDKLSVEVITELSDLIVARVAACCTRQEFRRRHFPCPPKGVEVAQLRLEHRTHLCLAREGFDGHAEKLGDHTIGEILDIRAFGPRCLVDLLSSLETWQANEHELDPELTREAEQLAAWPEASSASRDDPRFGLLIEGIDVEASDAKQLADRLMSRHRDPPDPRHASEQVRQLRERIQGLSKVVLEEELIQIFASTGHERNRGILISYYGWADGKSHTLAEVGARHSMTRERTRQICAKLIKRKNPKAIPAPVLDRTIDFIRQRLPVAVTRLEKEMIETGLTAVGLRLKNVRMSAKLLDRPIPFTVVRPGGGELAVAVEDSAIPAAVVEAAKKDVYYHGVSTVDQIHERLAERFPGRVTRDIAVETLELIDGFSWLGGRGDWFRFLTISRHGLPKAIEKILSVAGEISASEIRSAVGRNRRMWQEPPPESVILEFCRQTPNARVTGDLVAADPPQSWKKTLTGVEAKLVGILEKYGPVMERGELEDLCVADGVNRFSFHAFVACSPVIRQYGHSIYGLLGTNLSATEVESLAARRRAERAPQRVLDSHGRTEDGKIWLTYRLSKAASTYAVITVPAALKETVCGRFRLLSSDGRSAGTLAAKEGRAWGLGGFLRQHHAKAGDFVTITLDLEEQTARIRLGDP